MSSEELDNNTQSTESVMSNEDQPQQHEQVEEEIIKNEQNEQGPLGKLTEKAVKSTFVQKVSDNVPSVAKPYIQRSQVSRRSFPVGWRR